MVKWVVVGTCILIVLAIASVTALLLTRQAAEPSSLPPAPATAAPQPPPGPSTTQEKTLPSLQDQLASVEQKIQETQKSGQRQEVKVTVTEATANAELARALQSQQITSVKDAKLYFREGYMEIVLTTEVAGFTLSPRIKATVTVAAGKPQINVQSIDLGSLPLPGAIKDQVSKMIADQLSKIQLIDAPVEVTAVKISNQYMEITGLTKAQ